MPITRSKQRQLRPLSALLKALRKAAGSGEESEGGSDECSEFVPDEEEEEEEEKECVGMGQGETGLVTLDCVEDSEDEEITGWGTTSCMMGCLSAQWLDLECGIVGWVGGMILTPKS